MLQTTVTFEGNIATDLELTYTTTGKPVVRFPVNRRRKDPDTGEWADGEPTRHACVAFGTLGEHLADSLTKGDRVLIVGNVVTDTWDDKDTGDRRTAQRGPGRRGRPVAAVRDRCGPQDPAHQHRRRSRHRVVL
jgi:single-strand DNA-binding protein